MPQFILGVDGGGTKTHCALFDSASRLVDFLPWGTTNHELLPGGFAELRTVVAGMLETLARRNRLQWRNVTAVFGLAGVDSQAQALMVQQMLETFAFADALVCNDSYLGLKAGSPVPWGICSLNGTGTGACGIDPQGQTVHRGGLFALSGDYAGGKILGAEVVRAVYDMLYRDGKSTCLTQLLMQQLGQGDTDQIFEVLLERMTQGVLQSKLLAPLLFEAACYDDAVALEILAQCAYHCALDIRAVKQSLSFPADIPIPVVLLGSLYTRGKHPHLIESLHAQLCRQMPQSTFSLLRLEQPPVLGAVRWAMERSGGSLDLACAARQLQKAELMH